MRPACLSRHPHGQRLIHTPPGPPPNSPFRGKGHKPIERRPTTIYASLPQPARRRPGCPRRQRRPYSGAPPPRSDAMGGSTTSPGAASSSATHGAAGPRRPRSAAPRRRAHVSTLKRAAGGVSRPLCPGVHQEPPRGMARRRGVDLGTQPLVGVRPVASARPSATLPETAPASGISVAERRRRPPCRCGDPRAEQLRGRIPHSGKAAGAGQLSRCGPNRHRYSRYQIFSVSVGPGHVLGAMPSDPLARLEQQSLCVLPLEELWGPLDVEEQQTATS